MMQALKTPTDIVSGYLTAFYGGDFESAGTVLAEDFEFKGPFVSVKGRDAFLQSAQGLRMTSRGHRLLKQWQDGDDICSVYDLSLQGPHKSGTVTMAEWHTVRDGKIQSALVLFDSAAFREIVAPTGH
jgi:ketosteroid isomerase-like protein